MKIKLMEFKILAHLLRGLADNIDAGNSNITEAEMMEICEMISNSSNPDEKISKYQTAELLGVSHKTVDYYVRKRYIPHGRQEVGFKEIF
jgi:DNA-binding CsgD family transcriptional regulator